MVTLVTIVLSHCSRSRFHRLYTTDIWGQGSLCRGGRPVHCGMFITILGLSPLDVTSSPQMGPPKMPRDVTKHPRGKNCPWLRTTVLGRKQTEMG